MGTIADEINRLTLDAGARRCGAILDQIAAQVADCCGEDEPPPWTVKAERAAAQVEGVSKTLDELRAVQSAILERLTALEERLTTAKDSIRSAPDNAGPSSK